jgi:hypothetical protein
MTRVFLASEATHRLLSFIGRVTAAGYAPTQGQVNLYAAAPDRQGAVYESTFTNLVAFTEALQGTLGRRSRDAETPLQHLLRLDWCEISGTPARARLTALGEAVLRALNQEAAELPDTVEVVLPSGDPFAYAAAMGKIAGLGDALLVDPYLRYPQFLDLVEHTGVTRVLIGAKLSAEDRASIAVGIKVFEKRKRTVEVRVLGEGQLHDRVVVPLANDRPVLSLGTSLNGVGGRAVTVLNQVDDVDGVLRAAYQARGDAAQPLAGAKAVSPARRSKRKEQGPEDHPQRDAPRRPRPGQACG